MHARFLTGALRFLQQITVATFGGPEKIWWPADAAANTYTVPVACAAAPPDAQSRELSGLLTLDTGGRVFHCTLEDFPFPPEPDHVFVFGPPGVSAFDPGASQKFIVKSIRVCGAFVAVTATVHGIL